MRLFLACALLALGFAGCADQVVLEETREETSFDDFEVEADENTGVILGVVVDQSITPVEGADVVLTSSGEKTLTDVEGRFVFKGLEPGTYFLQVSRWGHSSAQASAEVIAGEIAPAVTKIQIEKIYTGEPYLDQFYFQGYFSCAYAIGVSSTCVNDYTRLCSPATVPVCCAGGCLSEIIYSLGIDSREYVYELGPNWQTFNLEWLWEPSVAGTAPEMGVTVSFFAREGASHRYTGGGGESPVLMREEMDPDCTHPQCIPPEGKDDLFVFFSASGGNVAIEQEWETFQHFSFHAPLPEDWSFIAGDENPFGT